MILQWRHCLRKIFKMNKNVILYGLSGNPTHIGHMNIANKLSDICDEVWMMLSYDSSTKKLIYANLRKKVLELSIKDLNNQKIKIFNYLIDNKIKEGTYFTLKNLLKNYLNIDFSFIIGYDNVIDITNWIEYEKLISENKFIIVNRPIDNNDLFNKNLLLFENYQIVNIGNDIQISSTMIRNDYLNNRKYISLSAQSILDGELL